MNDSKDIDIFDSKEVVEVTRMGMRSMVLECKDCHTQKRITPSRLAFVSEMDLVCPVCYGKGFLRKGEKND
jgi:hypothetical protein